MTPEQFTYWLEGFIQTAPGVTDQARKAIQNKIDQTRGKITINPPFNILPRPGGLPGQIYASGGLVTRGGPYLVGESSILCNGAGVAPVFVAQALAEMKVGPRTRAAISGERP